MTGRRVISLLALPVVAAGLSGCGHGSAAQRTPQLARLPLAAGSQISLRVLRCDTGANAYCAWELVVTGQGYRSSTALLLATQTTGRGGTGSAPAKLEQAEILRLLQQYGATS